MSQLESAIIGFAVGILCPAALFILGWWVAGGLVVYSVLSLPDSGIAATAFIGLGLGIVLDLLFLRTWRIQFYMADTRLLVLAYLFGSAVAVAFLMGAPFGNIAWGTVAGLYVGRRQHHTGASGAQFAEAARKAGLFTASVTAAEALPIGLLAQREMVAARILRGLPGWDPGVIAGLLGVLLVGVLCVMLWLIQYVCTRTAARIAFRWREATGRSV